MLNLLKKLFGSSTTTETPAVPYKLETPVVESKVDATHTERELIK